MATKTISFRATEEQVEMIERNMEKGNYTSKGEFLRSLLRNIEEKELSEKAKKKIRKARREEGGKEINEIL